MIDPKVTAQADALVAKGETVLRTVRPDTRARISRGVATQVASGDRTDLGLWSEWRSQSLNFLHRTLGTKDSYAVHFEERCVNSTVSNTEAGLGVLRAVREDIASGNLARLPEIVRAEVFSDFLEMADHLLSTGYKDAAAVMGGGVLEEHLRMLCVKNNIAPNRQTSKGPKPKMGDAMNNELAAANVYDKLQQKIVAGWLGIRNSAAHGKYGDYTSEQVANYLSGIGEYINRFPA